MKSFKKGIIGNIKVKNRIFRSAVYEGMAQNGKVTDKMKNFYQELSAGGTGLIITGFMSFAETDNPSPSAVYIGDESNIDQLKEITDIVHNNDSKIVAQLAHCGSQLLHPLQKDAEVFAPSEVIDPVSQITPKAFETKDLRKLAEEFGDAALRAKNAGFDGVQIHAAHGYLLSRFLSPAFNKRTDEYGGTYENNTRIIVEILNNIKLQCGILFPVWVKLNCSDFAKDNNGLDYEGFAAAAKMLSDNGINAIEVSGGLMAGANHSPSRSKKHEAYHLEYAKQIVSELDCPVILVGGLRDIDTIENILSKTRIEAVSMARALIREPDLINRWMDGKKDKAQCISCNGCFNPKGTKCFFHLDDAQKEEQKKIMSFMKKLG